ncbi:C-C motif chemokine 3 isoform X1 [Chlorocebus sabaeus]|uniref:C-C motif chemokine 3 isoform X1 n=1 Tax=Chlorocebus sabaeus TaxID=60711 RepID=UPI00045E0B7D
MPSSHLVWASLPSSATRGSEAAWPFLLRCAQAHSLPFSAVGADTPTSCCFSYISRQIPQNFIADYFETSSQCSKPGVIFLTKRGRQVCADPSEDWVQKYVSDLELSA